MSAPKIKQRLKEERKIFNRLYNRGTITHVTIAQDKSGKVILAAKNYERAQAALNKRGLQDAPIDLNDFEIEM